MSRCPACCIVFCLCCSGPYVHGVRLCVQLDEDDCREHVEVCPVAGVIATEIADRIAKYHGFALIADYGHPGEKSDTFRVPLPQNYFC